MVGGDSEWLCVYLYVQSISWGTTNIRAVHLLLTGKNRGVSSPTVTTSSPHRAEAQASRKRLKSVRLEGGGNQEKSEDGEADYGDGSVFPTHDGCSNAQQSLAADGSCTNSLVSASPPSPPMPSSNPVSFSWGDTPPAKSGSHHHLQACNHHYENNPFMSDLYHRSAFFLMLSEFASLQYIGSLDYTKSLCHV